MKTELITALIIAVGGLITAVGVQLRGVMGDRFKRKVDAAAALLSGYTEMVANLRTELNECQEASLKAVESARDHARRNQDQARRFYESERESWRVDKAELKAEIAEQREEIEKLQAQVYALMGRMDGRENHGDERTVPPS